MSGIWPRYGNQYGSNGTLLTPLSTLVAALRLAKPEAMRVKRRITRTLMTAVGHVFRNQPGNRTETCFDLVDQLFPAHLRRSFHDTSSRSWLVSGKGFRTHWSWSSWEGGLVSPGSLARPVRRTQSFKGYRCGLARMRIQGFTSMPLLPCQWRRGSPS